jgi:hypothetical protein
MEEADRKATAPARRVGPQHGPPNDPCSWAFTCAAPGTAPRGTSRP